MKEKEIDDFISKLSDSDKKRLLNRLQEEAPKKFDLVAKRRYILDNKQGKCPHCDHKSYTKFGFEKDVPRYQCKSCKRTFTVYTGTWMAHIHKKELLTAYIGLMEQELSLDKIKDILKINKKTAFDWRHKILSGLKEIDSSDFEGITESDDTFFYYSEKGKKKNSGKPRKRGGGSYSKTKKRIKKVSVLVTADRKSSSDLTVAKIGRIRKSDIERVIGGKITDGTILCTDSHHSFIGFAKDNNIKHHKIRAYAKEFARGKIYHVQHVNSMDSRLKNWMVHRFGGVSTKYLQKYLNWFKLKEAIRRSRQSIDELFEKAIENTTAWAEFKRIDKKHDELLQLST